MDYLTACAVRLCYGLRSFVGTGLSGGCRKGNCLKYSNVPTFDDDLRLYSYQRVVELNDDFSLLDLPLPTAILQPYCLSRSTQTLLLGLIVLDDASCCLGVFRIVFAAGGVTNYYYRH
jgi:hypothetical protein